MLNRFLLHQQWRRSSPVPLLMPPSLILLLLPRKLRSCALGLVGAWVSVIVQPIFWDRIVEEEKYICLYLSEFVAETPAVKDRWTRENESPLTCLPRVYGAVTRGKWLTPWCGFERRPRYLLSRKRGGGLRLLEEREWFVERKNGPWEEQMRGMMVHDQMCQCLAFTSFLKFTFNWRISAVRCCVGFSCPTTWISPKSTSALSLSSLPPASHSVPLL